MQNQKFLERLTRFSEKLLRLASKLPRTVVNLKLLDQLIPSGTAIGALYCEACEAESAKDFVHKIKIAKKEAKETKYWLRLLQTPKENGPFLSEIQALSGECEEYIRIFSSIVSKFKKRDI